MTHRVRQVLKSNIHAVDYESVCEQIITWAQQRRSCYVIPVRVSTVMEGFWRRNYQQIINNAALGIPEGKCLVWALRLLGINHTFPISATKLMLSCCDRAQDEGLSIYFYGATPLILAKLERNLEQWYPNLIIAGSHAPFSRQLTARDLETDLRVIRRSQAAIVFVGLDSPRQEEWMAQQLGKMDGVMIGVGDAFSFYTGHIPSLPPWVVKLRLTWLYYLVNQPQQYSRQYLINYPVFFGFVILQSVMRNLLKLTHSF